MFQFLKRLAQVGAVAAATAVLMSPQAADARSLDEILSSGTLKVGVNPTLPPLGTYDDKNQIVGFDVDYAQKLADMLGVKLEVVQVGSPDRIPFVASGKIDIVMGARRAIQSAPRSSISPCRSIPRFSASLRPRKTPSAIGRNWTVPTSPWCRSAAARPSSS